MLSYALSIFFIKLAVGILPWLTLIHIQDTGKTFFRLLIFLSLASSIISLIINPSFEMSLVVFIFLTFIVFLMMNRLKMKKIDWVILPLFIMGVVVLCSQDFDGLEGSYVHSFLNFLLGSLLLGAALVGMVTGHWYLIRPRLSFHYLIRSTLVFLVLSLFRVLFLGFTLFLENPWNFANAVRRAGEMMLLARFLWGGVLPLFFLILAYQCAKIHSNRSATGILYFTTASIFMGELMGDYLSVICGVPL